MEKTLPGGLLLRSLTNVDRERLADFYYSVYREEMADAHLVAAWAGDFARGRHPTVTDDDIWVVVDPAEGERVVSALLSIPQVWRYEDAPLRVARPELVATDKAYRRRGLVRALMNAAHERAAELGCNVQGITGIPHYYRQFGYTMAVHLGGGGYIPLNAVPPLPNGEAAKYSLRPATLTDITNLLLWDDWEAQHTLLSTVRNEAVWRYELSDTNPQSIQALDYHILVNSDGRGVGYVATRKQISENMLTVFHIAIGREASHLDVYGDLLRGLKAHAERCQPQPIMIGFSDSMHPTLFTLLDRTLPSSVRRRYYAWYLRVASPAQLMRDIAPVLARRLEGSGAHGYTGSLVIDYFDFNGLEMLFEGGRLTEARDVTMDESAADARFPWHLLLNMVFGYNTYSQMQSVVPEVYASGKGEVLLDSLFPVKRSSLFAIS